MTPLPPEFLDIDPYLRPIIHMAPLSGQLVIDAVDATINETQILDHYRDRLGVQGTPMLTRNAREALNRALAATVKHKTDIVSIITPSNCGYVSSCVTREIEKFCQWKFGIDDNAAIAVLIHEFGRYVETPDIYKQKQIPIIEDCAYAMVDRTFSTHYGQQGDFVVYSLSKALPIHFGGLLITRKTTPHAASSLTPEGRAYLLRQLHNHKDKLKTYNQARAAVYGRMQHAATQHHIHEKWPVKPNELAQAFIAELNPAVDADHIKKHMNAHGIESSIFYGGGGYFLPCHQNMTDADIAYIFAHLRRAMDDARQPT